MPDAKLLLTLLNQMQYCNTVALKQLKLQHILNQGILSGGIQSIPFGGMGTKIWGMKL